MEDMHSTVQGMRARLLPIFIPKTSLEKYKKTLKNLEIPY